MSARVQSRRANQIDPLAVDSNTHSFSKLSRAARRVGVLAPMSLELAPLVRELSLVETEPNCWHGNLGLIEVVATMTTIGMQPARHATQAMVERDVGHVMIVGIAGAVSNSAAIGSVVYPDRVVARSTGEVFRPMVLHDEHVAGAISCGDELITDASALDVLEKAGVVALDMESAAVASVCERAGVGWSVWRALSDHAGGGLIDSELFAMTNADGSADPQALQRALADATTTARLVKLGHDANLAAAHAAAAAIAAITRL